MVRGFASVILAVALAPAAAQAHGLLPVPQSGAQDPASVLTDTACDARFADDVANETGDPAAAKIKVFEAIPADRESDPAYRDEIQATVGVIIDHIAKAPGSRKSIRFDLGTACGARTVDILTLRLPKAASYYDSTCTTEVQEPARSHLKAAGPRNAIIFFATSACETTATGWAEMPYDDSPGPANGANRGGFVAVTTLSAAHTALHEIGHTLGAVQESAPHHDTTNHCWDNDDVMCYPYTQLAPQSPLRPCIGGDPFPFDCGQDDYFSPAPAPGSYLATHWNTYDSAFMCEIASCVPPAKPAEVTPPAATAPQVAAPPAAAAKPKAAKRRPSARAIRAARKRCRKVRSARKRAACVRRALKRPR